MLSSMLDGMRDFFLADETVTGQIATRLFRLTAPENCDQPWVVFRLSRAKAREKRLGGMGRQCDSVVSFRICRRPIDQSAAAIGTMITTANALDQALKVAAGNPLDGFTGTWGDQKINRALWDSDSYDERDDPELGLLVVEMDLLINHKPA